MVWYCTREEVKSALDFAETARNNGPVDRAIEAASRSIEALTLRRFYPQTATRHFDWPNRSGSRPWRLWLGQDELISITTLVAGGVTIAASDYFLEPANTGPPYTHVEVDLASQASFSAADTHQRAVAITGAYGHSAVDATAGALAAAIGTTSTTTVDVSDSAAIGVGDLIKVDSERMTVSDKTMLDTAQNASVLTASMSDVAITGVTAGTIKVGETILVDSERMLVVDVAGTTLTVKRAWDGSVLAAHNAGADIYAPRRLTVTRGVLGTTAATHLDATAVTRHVVPGPVRNLCIAESINPLQQETSGYGRTVGAGENAKDAAVAGLEGLRAEVLNSFGRARVRVRAV